MANNDSTKLALYARVSIKKNVQDPETQVVRFSPSLVQWLS